MAPHIPKFVHRKNDNGTFDSICLSCFGTVATALFEVELEGKERNHICDLWDLERRQMWRRDEASFRKD